MFTCIMIRGFALLTIVSLHNGRPCRQVLPDWHNVSDYDHKRYRRFGAASLVVVMRL